MINNKGQTVLELLVVLTMIVLFLSGVMVIQLLSLRNVQYSQKKSQATKLAQEQLERIRVVRDSSGMDALDICLIPPGCYINDRLTPVQITPTGIYSQTVFIVSEPTGCMLPNITVTPTPMIYAANVNVSWSGGAIDLTPPAEINLSSCITDWR